MAPKDSAFHRPQQPRQQAKRNARREINHARLTTKIPERAQESEQRLLHDVFRIGMRRPQDGSHDAQDLGRKRLEQTRRGFAVARSCQTGECQQGFGCPNGPRGVRVASLHSNQVPRAHPLVVGTRLPNESFDHRNSTERLTWFEPARRSQGKMPWRSSSRSASSKLASMPCGRVSSRPARLASAASPSGVG